MAEQTDGEPTRVDIPALHAGFGSPRELIARRRAVYELALRAISGGDALAPAPRSVPVGVLDNPMSRFHIGRAIEGGPVVDAGALLSVADLTTKLRPRRGPTVAVVSHPDADRVLSPVMSVLAHDLGQTEQTRPKILTVADGDDFDAAAAMVRGALSLAYAASPALTRDLLPHVSALAFTARAADPGFISASPQNAPGLMLAQYPISELDLAEALIHEAAHAKLFELAITRAMFTADSYELPEFHPSWHAPGTAWKIRQTLPAAHTYACLAQFADDLGVSAGNRTVAPQSLLPNAAVRRDELFEYLWEHNESLGADARLLLAGLSEADFTVSQSTAPQLDPRLNYELAGPLWMRRAGLGDMAVLLRTTPEFALFNMAGTAADALAALRGTDSRDAARRLAEAWGGTAEQAHVRLLDALSESEPLGLVRPVQTAKSAGRSRGRRST